MQHLLVKYGRVYSDRASEVAAFEREIGHALPSDFLDLIGDYCEGGFDGHYSVHDDEKVEIRWHHLLLMKTPDAVDSAAHNALSLVGSNPNLFGKRGELRLLPFGEAYAARHQTDEIVEGYLAFDIARSDAIVFVPLHGDQSIGIARSIREMMLQSTFESDD